MVQQLLHQPSLSKLVFGLYLLLLIWLVLFKFTLDLPSLFEYPLRVINLIPFNDVARDNVRETIYNLVVFIPFGLLLGVTFKRYSLWQKLSIIFAFSLAAETIQYALAIGRTDITDIITNTLGGLLGLATYYLSNRYVETEKLDKFITVTGLALIIFFLLTRLLLINVAFRSAPSNQPPMDRQRQSSQTGTTTP